jgi:hypothetical protein
MSSESEFTSGEQETDFSSPGNKYEFNKLSHITLFE